jgi:ribosomal protein L11 methyltransferase
MTSHCLSIGPVSRQKAERCASELETHAPELQALSISTIDHVGACWRVDAYCSTAEQAVRTATIAVSLGYSPRDFEIVDLAGTDWVGRSLQGLSPVRAGRFFVHGSHDRAMRPHNAVTVEIEASTAFGTGHHATTRGCLLALDRLLRRSTPRRILDIGCGSGVLAIAAAKAMRRSATAGDIDPEAVRLARLNAQINGVKLVAVVANGTQHPSIRDRGPYDLIMANILARPLAELAPSLARRAAKPCHLILSGLLAEQRSWVEQVYRQWSFMPVARHTIDGWTSLVLRHGPRQKKDHRDEPWSTSRAKTR